MNRQNVTLIAMEITLHQVPVNELKKTKPLKEI